MLISPENKPGFYVQRSEVVAVVPTSGCLGPDVTHYAVFLRDGRSFSVSIEHGGELLKKLPR